MADEASARHKCKRGSWWADAAHVDDTGPLEGSAAPGWEPCLTSLAKLQRCELPDLQHLAQLPPETADVAIERYAELGGSVIRVLQQTFELHHALGRVSSTGAPPRHPLDQLHRHRTGRVSALQLQRAADVSDVSLKPVDLLPSHALGKALEWMPLYKHVMTSQQERVSPATNHRRTE